EPTPAPAAPKARSQQPPTVADDEGLDLDMTAAVEESADSLSGEKKAAAREARDEGGIDLDLTAKPKAKDKKADPSDSGVIDVGGVVEEAQRIPTPRKVR